jgi:GT2 family glycosyltransferase
MCSKRKCEEEVNVIAEKKAQVDGLPSVSVIVALYNAESYIVECMESLIAQSYKGNIEVSVHDDASTDRSILVLEVYFVVPLSLTVEQSVVLFANTSTVFCEI